MRNFFSVLNKGWQTIKATVSTLLPFGKRHNTKMKTGSSSSSVEIPMTEMGPSPLAAMHKKFISDYASCRQMVELRNTQKKPLTTEHVDQIKRLFDDYFKLIAQAKKEKNSVMEIQLQRTFFGMTNKLFNGRSTPACTAHVTATSAAKPVVSAPPPSPLDTEQPRVTVVL